MIQIQFVSLRGYFINSVEIKRIFSFPFKLNIIHFISNHLKLICSHKIECFPELAQCHFDQRNAAAGKCSRTVDLVFAHAMCFSVVIQIVMFKWKHLS